MFKRTNKRWKGLAWMLVFCMLSILTNAETPPSPGAYSFNFVPRTGVSDGTATAIQTLSFEVKRVAPMLIPETPWHEGDTTLDIALAKYNDCSVPYAGAEDWYDQINTVYVNGTAIDLSRISLDYERSELMISGFGLTGYSVTAIEITTIDNMYKDATWVGTATQIKKTGGTLEALSDVVVSDTNAVIGVTAADDSWADGLAVNTYMEGIHVENVTYSDFMLYIPVTIAADTLEENVTVTVTQAYYNDATVTFKVVAPTKADADALTPSVKYSAAEFETGDVAYVESEFSRLADKDKQAMFGKASITLPSTGANGSSITWKINGEPVAADTVIALKRPSSAGDDAVIEVTAEAAKRGYKTAVKTWNLSVYKINVTTSLTATDIKIDDTIKLTAQLKLADVYNGTLVAALYNDENKMVHVNLYAASKTVAVELPTGDAKYLKLIWLNLNTLAPYCEFISIDIQ